MQTNRNIQAGVLLLLLLPALTRLHADSPQGHGAPLDSSAVQLRPVPEGALLPYLTDAAFLYGRDRTELSFWDLLQRWFWEKVRHWEWVERQPLLEKVLLGAVVVLGIWLLVRQLFGVHLRGLFYSSPQQPSAQFPKMDEDIQKVDFEQHIHDAVEQRHYRLAIRLHYLKSLKMLADQNLIDWKTDKINQDYMRELADSPLQAPFVEITALFERIWYGDTALVEASFQRTEAVFQRFGHQLAGTL
jgi:hypothetical protein